MKDDNDKDKEFVNMKKWIKEYIKDDIADYTFCKSLDFKEIRVKVVIIWIPCLLE